MFPWFKRPCRHEWSVSGVTVEGVTLGWGGETRRQLGFSSLCGVCGATKYEGGTYLPGDDRLYPEWYGPDGWPIDPSTGERLGIADRKNKKISHVGKA